MRKLLAALIIAQLFASCGSSKVITTKAGKVKYGKNDKGDVTVTFEPNSSNTDKPNSTTEKPTGNLPDVNNTPINTTDKVVRYIHKYKDIARYEMSHSRIPASITLAQGILESGAGEGELTQRANNHFGIKCHGWQGEKVYHDDDKKGECFRKYPHPAQSFKDHSVFLTGRKRYASLFKLKVTDYKGWAKGLKKAGYATDPKYPNKLIRLIERYKLYQYDTGVSAAVEESVTNTSTAAASVKTYTVKKGDTLYSISRAVGVSVATLKSLNHLSSNALSIGQKLIIKK